MHSVSAEICFQEGPPPNLTEWQAAIAEIDAQ
jgi:hypothetical protein